MSASLYRGYFRSRARLAGAVLPRGDALDWLHMLQSPAPVQGAPGTYTSLTQPGARIAYVDPQDGEVPAGATLAEQQGNALGMLLFFDGTRLIDRTGSPTNPVSGLAYGTDPLLPGPGVRAFKHYAAVEPKMTGEPVWGDGRIDRTAFGVRNGYGDWLLVKRGSTLSRYSDLRSYMDATGRAGVPIDYRQAYCRMTPASGSSELRRGVLGVYGPVELGRARVIDPIYGYFGGSASASDQLRHTITFGFMADGLARAPDLQPIDYSLLMIDMQNGAQEAGEVNGLGVHANDVVFEDMHWHCTVSGPSANSPDGPDRYRAPNALWDYTLRRSIVNDTWQIRPASQCYGERAGADPVQALPANTTTTLLLPTKSGGGAAAMDAAGGTYTTPTAGEYLSVLAVRVAGTVALGGTVRLGLYVGETLADSKTLPGTGVAGDTYKFSGALRVKTVVAAGQVLSLRITSTGASSALTVPTGGLVRAHWCTDSLNFNGGIGGAAHAGARVLFEDNIIMRCGFGVPARMQHSAMPDGTTDVRWESEIRSHNIYFLGNAVGGELVYRRNVSLLGTAGELFRCASRIEGNFFYSGYVKFEPEHVGVPFTQPKGAISHNVIQVYANRSSPINGTAQPGWGLQVKAGANIDIEQNVISHAAPSAQAYGQFGVQLSGVDTPYFRYCDEYRWTNDTTVRLTGNIIDSFSAGLSAEQRAIFEQAGASRLTANWRTPITGWSEDPAVDLTGTTITCTPQPGYTGTPQYQWVRVSDADGGHKSDLLTAIPGATNQTYTLGPPGANSTPTGGTSGVGAGAVGGDWGRYDISYQISERVNELRVTCLVTGITYPAHTGIAATLAGNVVVQPTTTKPLLGYVEQAATAHLTPAASVTDVSSTTVYPSYAAAQASRGGSNWAASLLTHMQSLGAVASADGFVEYDAAVIGNNPQTTALRRGRENAALGAVALVNHVRTGRGMAPLA